jgi:curli biogenesis system outer membrane secretion channel CsgG
MMIQQSNCFIVVERGAGMRNVMQERQLAGSGEMRDGSNMGQGQMVAADFVMTPAVVFSEGNAGGIGGGAISRLGGGLVGGIVGGLKFKEAQTSMLVADARTTVQVAAAEGSTKKADMRLGGLLFGGGGGAAAGGYGNTNEGKIIAAAFMDNYNNIVQVVRNDPSLQRIAGIKLLSGPTDTAKVVATLTRNDEFIVMGEEKDGYVQVQGANASGWVKITMMQKR